MDCPFCPPHALTPIAESLLSIAIADRYPVTEGHTLVIPRRHVASFFDLTADEQLDLLKVATRAREILLGCTDADGFNLGINDGENAGQTVMHVHLHLIPRRVGDQADPRGGIRWMFPEKARYWETTL